MPVTAPQPAKSSGPTPNPKPITPPETDDFSFLSRHLGPNKTTEKEMLQTLGLSSLEELVQATLPQGLASAGPPRLPPARSETRALADLEKILATNRPSRSLIGLGYHGTITPPVLRRAIVEDPGWYSSYTPYQPEISQGRLEALLNYQTMVLELTGMEIANASLLDEGTAAAEAASLAQAAMTDKSRRTLWLTPGLHPSTASVISTRANALGWKIIISETFPENDASNLFAGILAYPESDGRLADPRPVIDHLKKAGALSILVADPLSLFLFTPPGELGADVAVGSTQRFGVPVGFGGPHAAYFATRVTYQRLLPGRLIGVSKDSAGRTAYRLSLQTREQHIRRDRATSNICTAQALLATLASMYAIHHGPKGLYQIALRIHQHTQRLAAGLKTLGLTIAHSTYFDTLHIQGSPAKLKAAFTKASQAHTNFRQFPNGNLGITLDERTDDAEVDRLLSFFGATKLPPPFSEFPPISTPLSRTTPALRHPIFTSHANENELLRYIRRLAAKDLTPAQSMVPLGSCTMKLNAASELTPLGWSTVAEPHPYAPAEQNPGYLKMIHDLETWLGEITGLPHVSLQPNAGSQGEYAGLLSIRAWHQSRRDTQRDICLIPVSAHGTNPASAVLVGFRVVPVACDSQGNVDLTDLDAKLKEHGPRVAAAMITYPSTHGVYETAIRDICKKVHQAGGQVYMDGANLNALVGICRPGEFGVDACHLNLHKTFCIPHGGGGPGVGPIAVADHLAPFLPSHPHKVLQKDQVGAVASAPYGSASILVIPWMFLAMVGGRGLARCTEVAILNANYLAKRLSAHYPILYRGAGGWVAHEFILDFRPFKAFAGIEVEDVAKRLMDYGFHAPTMSWPVGGTLMIEPTESESREELDRFADALISIRKEIAEIESGKMDRVRNPLKLAPHPAADVVSDAWDRPYSRDKATYPAPWTRIWKYWPTVSRIDAVHGDRNLICSCPTVEELAS
ncbi:MAG: glycine dehydrogenase (aminomethyl-transferring) [Verrucomicrobia bacterium]|nr:glycine dehydrogenase (aminomethyl-transferring) [Verrucomicrobiota bacterium]